MRVHLTLSLSLMDHFWGVFSVAEGPADEDAEADGVSGGSRGGVLSLLAGVGPGSSGGSDPSPPAGLTSHPSFSSSRTRPTQRHSKNGHLHPLHLLHIHVRHVQRLRYLVSAYGMSSSVWSMSSATTFSVITSIKNLPYDAQVLISCDEEVYPSYEWVGGESFEGTQVASISDTTLLLVLVHGEV
ncbi:hypothetical protein GYMLUDRAFT_250762 [Collybiopsis luxurians FD-317 M1]|uniref:Uncharacterized protein n=1 Tax=Collybiopsis luxurians FD-317 M1 TaxID=944289 RepID=A0A0D0BEA4_9AGAR|nr:hypothetical protein GYMLUDRAFT_250762 [Collybiopsis luxurians FD-317 M1]